MTPLGSVRRSYNTPTKHSEIPSPTKRLGFRRDVEGLRGVAVLAVVLFHAGVPGFGGGFVGVDVFFVLSGYLITGLLLKEYESTGRISFARFYARRIRRLLPAAMLMLVVVCGAGSVIYSPLEQLRYASTAMATAAYASNIWFLISAADYFSPSVATNPFLHMWSLAVEEQFYLVWPLLVLAGCWHAASRKRLLAVLAAVTITSIGLSIWLTAYRSTWAFFLTPTRAWEFGAGGLLALIPSSAYAQRRTPLIQLGWIGGLALLAAVTMFSASTPFPGIAALLPVLATVAMLAPGHFGTVGGVTIKLSARWWQTLGRLSYSWYLWHWPVILIALVFWPAMPLAGRVSAGVFALVLAQITYQLVERPVRDSALLVRPGRAGVLGATLTAAGLLSGFAWGFVARSEASAPNQRPYVDAANSRSILDSRACIPKPTDASLHECVIGSATSQPTIVAIGDSHLAHWYLALDSLGKAENLRVITLIKPGCPTAAIRTINERLGREYRECELWRMRAIQRVIAINPLGVILATSHRLRTTTGEVATVSQWQDGFIHTLREWDARGIRTVIIRETPTLTFSAPECLSAATFRRESPAAKCFTPESVAVDSVQYRGALRATAQLKNAAVLDFTSQLCPTNVCPAVLGRTVVYKDDSHLNSAFVREMRPSFVAQMRTLLFARNARRDGDPQ